eukprot:gene5038-8634_t
MEKIENDISYIYSKNLVDISNLLPIHKNRSSFIHELISSFDLFEKMEIIEAIPAKKKELLNYHSKEYIEKFENLESDEEEEEEIFEGIFEYIKMISGATLTACRTLMNTDSNICINWEGGRHHAKKSKSSGFCYVNDIVLGILELLKKYKKIMYIDIDVHHGDGVEEAFYSSPNVFTVSFHMHGPGIFPNSGFLESTGKGRGKNFNINVPLKEGIDDENYFYIFEKIIKNSFEKFKPEVCIMVCGADGLSGDPLGKFNLTQESYSKCLKLVLNLTQELSSKLLVLGGGGYNNKNVSKLFTTLTSIILNEKISNDIPENEKYFELYAPEFNLEIKKGKDKNLNSKEDLDEIIDFIMTN